MTSTRKPQPSIDFGYPTPADGPVPAFNSIEEEAEFWDTHDVTDFIKGDAEEFELVLGPELRRQKLIPPDTSADPDEATGEDNP